MFEVLGRIEEFAAIARRGAGKVADVLEKFDAAVDGIIVDLRDVEQGKVFAAPVPPAAQIEECEKKLKECSTPTTGAAEPDEAAGMDPIVALKLAGVLFKLFRLYREKRQV